MLERKIIGWKRICRTDLRQNYLYNYLGVSFYFLLSLFLYACAKMAGRIGSWDGCVRGTRWARPPRLSVCSLSLSSVHPPLPLLAHAPHQGRRPSDTVFARTTYPCHSALFSCASWAPGVEESPSIPVWASLITILCTSPSSTAD